MDINFYLETGLMILKDKADFKILQLIQKDSLINKNFKDSHLKLKVINILNDYQKKVNSLFLLFEMKSPFPKKASLNPKSVDKLIAEIRDDLNKQQKMRKE